MCSVQKTLAAGVKILKGQAAIKNIKLTFHGYKGKDSFVMMDGLRM